MVGYVITESLYRASSSLLETHIGLNHRAIYMLHLVPVASCIGVSFYLFRVEVLFEESEEEAGSFPVILRCLAHPLDCCFV